MQIHFWETLFCTKGILYFFRIGWSVIPQFSLSMKLRCHMSDSTCLAHLAALFRTSHWFKWLNALSSIKKFSLKSPQCADQSSLFLKIFWEVNVIISGVVVKKSCLWIYWTQFPNSNGKILSLQRKKTFPLSFHNTRITPIKMFLLEKVVILYIC